MKLLQKVAVLCLIGIVTAWISSSAFPAEASFGFSGNGNVLTKCIDYLKQKFGFEKAQDNLPLHGVSVKQRASGTPRPTFTPQQMAQRDKKRFDRLVEEGKLTAEQEKAILEEMAILREKYPLKPNDGKTYQERKNLMDAMKAEWGEWAKRHGIDESVFPVRGWDRTGKPLDGSK